MTLSYGHIPSLIPRSNGGSAEITAKSDRRPPLSRICTSSSPWIAVATNGCCIVWPEFEAFQLLWFWIIILFDRNWDNLNEDVIIPVLFYGNGLVRLQRSRLVSVHIHQFEEARRMEKISGHSTSPSVFPIVKLKISGLHCSECSYSNYSPHLVLFPNRPDSPDMGLATTLWPRCYDDGGRRAPLLLSRALPGRVKVVE